MRRLLVTGGAGFIGANFCHFLIEHTDVDVTVLDKLTYAASLAALEGLPTSRLHVVVGDICDRELVQRLIDEHDTVVHFAAESHNDRSLADPAPFIQTNVVGTFVLIEAAARAGVRFHHISTDEVYGDLPLDSAERFTEASPYRPSSPYSASKASADHLVRAWVRSCGLQATISNCSNNYGPWQHVEKFIPRQITTLIDGGTVKLYGSGLHVRDWIHVDDHSAAVWAILQRGRIGETYLIGANAEHSNRSVAEHVLAQFGRAADQIDWVRDRPGHDLRYAIDPTKLTSELGWEPQLTDFVAGVAHTVQWYRDHEAWWRPKKAETEAAYAERGQ